jgi:hypothetical protein
MSEIQKISELDRLQLENIKLKMDSLRPTINKYTMLQHQAQNTVKLLADGLKVKPEQLKIDVSTGQYEIVPLPEAPKEKKKNAK